jgi:acyl-CoA dehydrogenase-like protein
MMDATERALLEETVGAALASAGSMADTGPAADAALTGIGWLEMLEAEPSDAMGIVFGALGATNAMATALDDVIVAALGLPPRADLAVLLPQFGEWGGPGRVTGSTGSGIGLTTARATVARDLLVVGTSGSAVGAITVPLSSAGLRAVHGIDPAAGFHTARLEPVPGVEVPLHPDAWATAVAIGRRAVAHQIAGATRTMLTLACDHARERVQFGRPIASFQAVRHRLAEALVAVEALDATLGAAADEPNSLTAALAKATAGRTAQTVAGHCQQVLAGIGFTTDHPFHRFLKRTMLLEGLFGSADAIAIDVGRQLLTERRVPTLIEL